MKTECLLIASRDPYTHVAARRCYELAAQLADEGRRVTLFLVQNGVLPAREGSGASPLAALAGHGVRVLADEFSLRERGISPQGLLQGVTPASLEVVIEALEDGAQALWH
jgi:sulfur relay (sulfurtransferase) complex TusBCD TusD component (DsrE family)